MVDEAELYLQRKREQRAQSALSNPVATEDAGGNPTLTAQDYVVRKNEQRRQNATVTATKLTQAGNPDENAADDQLAQEHQTYVNPDVKAPPSFVASNRDRMRADVDRFKMTTTLSSSPMLMKWLDNEANARVAADDVPALSGVETGLGHIRDALKRGVVDRSAQIGSQMLSDMYDYRAGQRNMTFAERYKAARGKLYDKGFFPDMPEGATLPDLEKMGDEPVTALVKAWYGTYVDQVGNLFGRTKEDDTAVAQGWQKAAADAAARAASTPMSETAQRAMQAFTNDGKPLTLKEAAKKTLDLAINDPGALAAMVAETGIESVGALIPATVATAATKNPAVGAATLGATSYATERYTSPVEFFAKRGFDLTKPDDVKKAFANPNLMKEAADYGATRGLIVGALDFLSGGIAGKALAKNPIADYALQMFIQGGLGGGGEGLAQYATNGEVNFGDVVVEALAEFATAPIDVAAVGGRKFRDRRAAATTALDNEAKVGDLSAAAQESKLRERAPEKFREFVADATKDGDAENMYVPAEEFMGYFQAQDIPVEQAAEMLPGVDVEQVKRAAVTGEDVIVPTATYLERIAGSDMDKFMMEHAKFNPEGMTVAEARAFKENEQLDEAKLSAQQEAARIARTADDVTADNVRTTIEDQLVEAGRPRMAAKQEAELYPAFYRALASRMGTSVEDVVSTYAPPTIEGPRVDEAAPKKVDALTREIAGLRERQKQIVAGGAFEKGAKADNPANARVAKFEGMVRELGLDPAVATDEEIRTAVEAENKLYKQTSFNDLLEEFDAINRVGVKKLIEDTLGTTAFKKWFSGSKVVNAKGAPLVVYHGTKENAFMRFNTEGGKGKTFGTGAFFTSDKNVSDSYGKTSYDVYLSLKNPMEVDAKGANWDRIGGQEWFIEDANGDGVAYFTDEEEFNDFWNSLDPEDGYTYTRTDDSENALSTDDLAREARAKGYDGLIVRNVVDNGAAHTRNGATDIYVAFAPEQIKSATNNSGAFDPTNPNIYSQNTRGQIRIPKDGPRSGAAIIELYKSANLSTFLHESGHFFLSVLQDAAAQENAAQAVKDMHAQTQAWFRENAAAVAKEVKGVSAKDVQTYIDDGTTGDAVKDASIDTGMQEQWARAFETYLMEGKAPTAGLRAAFEQFRVWLLEVYRKVKGNLDVPISDDIRQVFDMLLATDDELKNAEVDNNGGMIASTAKELGISEDDYRKLAELHQEAQDQMAAEAIREAMRPVKRMREEAYKARREQIRGEVEAEVNARPVYRAIEWLGNKRWLGREPGEQPKVPNGMRLSKEQLVERYGPGVLRTLPRGSFRVYSPGGMDIDEAAGWFGFKSGDEMVKAMEAAPRREDVIGTETDKRAMAELAKDEGVVEGAATAVDAFHADKRGDYIAAELRTLNKGLGEKDRRTSTASYARQVARRTMGGMKARDAVASNRYLVAERRAAERAQAAFAAGDRAKAADYKRQQLFNHMMYNESRKVAEEVGKTERLAKRLASKGTRENLANEYLGAIDDVLEQYDFRKIGPGRENRRARMLAYIDMMKAQGRENEIAIPQHIIDNAKAEPYMTLPVDRLRGVYTTLRNIESTARRAQKLIDAKNERDMAKVVNDIADAFAENVKAKPPARIDSRSERFRRGARGFLDLVLNADTLLREIDGFKETEGPAYQNIKEGIDKAMATLQVRREEAAHAFDKLYSVYTSKERSAMTVNKFVPALNMSMSKWDLISVVLNMGNADNLQRLTDPRVKGAFTQAQLDSVVRMMDKRDMDFVQSVWDYVDSFYGEIAARETRVTGVAPQKVEAQALDTPHGVYKGGYYPLKYDARLSSRVAEESNADIMDNMRAGRFGKAQTRNGHTKERSQSSGRPVLIDMGVLHSHVNTVLHDLVLSEEVTNAWRVLQDERVKGLFLDSGKQADHEALEMWVQDVATGQLKSSDLVSNTARFLKSGFTVSKLAFNLSTAAVQITGLSQSIVVVGKENFVRGVAQYAAAPARLSREIVEKSPFMAERQATFNKDLYDISGELSVGPTMGAYKRFMKNVMGPLSGYLMKKIQFYAVDMPTWLAAYGAEIRRSGVDADAIQFADRSVARAQASGLFSDRTAIERGNLNKNIRQSDVVRLFTTLGSYMFAKANVAYERTMKTDFTSPKEVLSYTVDMALLFTVEAILYNAIKGTLPGMGEGNDDEDKRLAWLKFLSRETALSVASTMPFVRDVASATQGFSTGGAYGSILDTLIRPLHQASQGEVDKAFVKSTVDATGMLLHYPSTQVNRFIDAAWRSSEGEDVAPIEFIMGKR